MTTEGVNILKEFLNMGKLSEDRHCKDEDTKILFERSWSNYWTTSKTGSLQSRTFSRNGFQHIKKKRSSNRGYYLERGILKRDLSIETDICILKRHYRNMKNNLNNQDTINPELWDIPVFDDMPDKSACGDMKDQGEEPNTFQPINADLNTLIMKNFIDLMNQWIQINLGDINEKDKLNCLNSIISKLKEPIETSTYTLCSIKDRKTNDKSITYNNNVKLCSKLTHLAPYPIYKAHSSFSLQKPRRLISTLSVPRNYQRYCTKQNHTPNIKQESYKSFKIHQVSNNFLQEPFNNNDGNFLSNTLVKSPASDSNSNNKLSMNVSELEDDSQKTNDLVEEKLESDLNSANLNKNRDFENLGNKSILHHGCDRPSKTAHKCCEHCHIPPNKTSKKCGRRSKIRGNRRKLITKSKLLEEGFIESELSRNLKSILKYLSEFNEKSKNTVDINININPDQVQQGHTVKLTKTSRTTQVSTAKSYILHKSSVKDIKTSARDPLIIPIFDAENKSKFLFQNNSISNSICSETLKPDSEDTRKKNEYFEDLIEIHDLVKKLVDVTEYLNQQLLKEKLELKPNEVNDKLLSTLERDVSTLVDDSKNQKFISKESQWCSPFNSGIKLEIPQKTGNKFLSCMKSVNTSSSHNKEIGRLVKLSTVNELKSKAQSRIVKRTVKKESITQIALNFHPPHKHALTFYCNNITRDNIFECAGIDQASKPCSTNSFKKERRAGKKKHRNLSSYNVSMPHASQCQEGLTTSTCDPPDMGSSFENAKFEVLHRRGIGFWEGSFYCILYWLPILIIAYFYYRNVLKPKMTVKPSSSITNRRSGGDDNFSESTVLAVISELGF